MELLDIIAVAISVTLMLGYHAYFVYSYIRKPHQVVAGWTTKVRTQWVVEILKKKSGDILAVQTLRNWILSATFLATVSMFVSFGLLQFLTQTARVEDPRSNSLIIRILTDDLVGPKTVVILCFNFMAFFCFSQSIRYFNHVGFTINIPMEDTVTEDSDSIFVYESADHVAHLLNVGAKFFTLGMRAFFFSIPATFWYFGPISLMVATVVVLFAISMGDIADASEANIIRKPKKSVTTVVAVQ
jgi:uncharacterized membrane protein